jgi:hypothetical protein
MKTREAVRGLPQLETAWKTFDRCSQGDDDPSRALHAAVAALGVIAERAGVEGAFASVRERLMRRGTSTLSTIIRRGVASGAFQPDSIDWAIEGLPRAIVAGVCARWVFGLVEKRSLRAGTAAEAALEILRPRAFPSAHGALT